jgi:predicted HicB family RNase H-like nuclease
MVPRGDSIKRESTSIKIRPDVWKEAKIEAIRQDIELSELVEQAIDSWILEQSKKRGDRK